MSVVSVGSLNNSIVHPREVFKIAVLSNAASIVLFHNHKQTLYNKRNAYGIIDKMVAKNFKDIY